MNWINEPEVMEAGISPLDYCLIKNCSNHTCNPHSCTFYSCDIALCMNKK